VNGSNEVPGDQDWFSFTASKMGVYQIQTSGLGPGSDTILQLYRSDGTSMVVEDDDFGPELGASQIIQPISPGLYYAVVFQKGTGVGTYKISVIKQ
jgi:hypothetical protein